MANSANSLNIKTAGIPVFDGVATFTPSTTTQFNVLVGNTANAIANVAPSATSGVPLISQGNASNPTFGTAVVAGGGTGAVSFTAHGVMLGEGTSPLGVTAVGTSGQVLTGVTGADPVWASPAASSISLTGDSGGALTGAAFTLTGGTTGLTFAGAVSTETLGGTLAIANGGTNATSFGTTDGTIYYDGTRLIATATGTVGQFLRSGGAGVAPAYATLPASSISITGNSGGALTGAAFTFTGGTTGLTFAGAGTTETLGGTLAIANGGTNATSMTNTNGVAYYDGTRIVTTTVGTATNVLTSNGSGVAPTFQAPAASSISITGNSGGALTGNAFTFTGGTTGLTFSGAGTTETLTGTLAIANGGTNATSMATTDGVVYYDGTRLVTTAAGTATQVLTSNGAGVAPTFQAVPSSGGLSWSEQTGTTQAMAVAHGYILNNAGTVTATLPATAALGDLMAIVGKGTGGWLVAQNSGQTIHYGSINTTTGAGGSLASTSQYDSFEIVCITANTDFVVRSSIGNLTVV